MGVIRGSSVSFIVNTLDEYENEYYSCAGIDDVFYNPVTESVIFSKEIVPNFGKYTSIWSTLFGSIKHPISGLSRLIEKWDLLF